MRMRDLSGLSPDEYAELVNCIRHQCTTTTTNTDSLRAIHQTLLAHALSTHPETFVAQPASKAADNATGDVQSPQSIQSLRTARLLPR